MQDIPNWQDEIIVVNDQLKLHSVNEAFSEALYDLVVRNKAALQKAMDWPKQVKSAEDTRKTLQGNYLLHHRGYAKMFMILQQDRLIGVLSFNQIEPTNKTAYIGYWLDEAWQGKGLLSQALQAFIARYADSGEVRRFVIKCRVANEASNRVALRNGFRLEGTLKEAEYLNGQFYDQNIYALIVDKRR